MGKHKDAAKRASAGDGGGGGRIGQQPRVHPTSDDCYPLNKLCRLCLLSNTSMEPIFAYTGDIELSQRIFQCTGLEIHENEDKGIPTSICGQCRRQLDQCYEFRTLCWKNNDVLRNLNLILSPKKVSPEPVATPTMMSAIPIVQVEKLKINPSLLSKNKVLPKPKASISSKNFEISLSQLYTPSKRGHKGFNIPPEFSRKLVIRLTPMSPALVNKYRKKAPKTTQTKAAVKSFPSTKATKDSRVEKKSATPKKLAPIKIKVGRPKLSKTEKTPSGSAKKSKAKTADIPVPPKKRKENFQSPPEATVLTISCTLCTQTFSNMKNLSRHTAAHENNRKQNRVFNCDVCQKEYLAQDQLTDHLRSAEHVNNAASNAPDDADVSILPDEQSILPDTNGEQENISTTVATPTDEIGREASPDDSQSKVDDESAIEVVEEINQSIGSRAVQTPRTIRQLSPISVDSDSPKSDDVQYSDVCSTNNEESFLNGSTARRVSFADVTEILD